MDKQAAVFIDYLEHSLIYTKKLYFSAIEILSYYFAAKIINLLVSKSRQAT